MDSDEGKLFIGGIAWDTTEERLRDYFGQFGEVTQTVIMRDKTTDRPRGFGFVVFADPSILDTVLQSKHTIDGRAVEAKRALSREEQQNSSRYGNSNVSRSSGEAGKQRTKKIFVGGLPPTLTEDGFREYFEGYGQVTDVVIMYDQSTQRPRGFGFISFDTEDAVDRVLHKTFHDLNGKHVEVKRALPKDASPGGGGGGGRGGGYQSYSSGANASSLDGRMDGNRFMQAQGTGGGYPPYSGYGAPSYGYGAANSSVGYGAYGGYGVAGYGTAHTGFGGPAGGYGNPTTPNTGYVSGPPGSKSQWSGQTTGYGASGYSANAGYGVAGGGGSVSAPVGQSPGGASLYGSQGYGYGNYGGSEGFYTNSGGSTGGGEQQGTGGGYMGSGYGNNNGTSGY